MIPKAMASLDLVEAVILIEEVIGTEIPTNDAETFAGPREVVGWLEPYLSNQRPNTRAAALLRKLARDHNDPELAEGLEGTWRREQIAAIVREIFRQQGFERLSPSMRMPLVECSSLPLPLRNDLQASLERQPEVSAVTRKLRVSDTLLNPELSA